MIHAFGRRPVSDPRDRRYPMRLLLDPLRLQYFPRGLPPGTRHYRPGKVLDQGNTGSCVGFGWAGWVQGAPLMTKHGPTPFEIYDAAVLVDEFDDNDVDTDRQLGTSVRAGVQVLQARGHVKNYLWAESVENIRSWHLAGLGTIVLGINWYEGMEEPARGGFLRPDGEVLGGHCIHTTGWSDTKGGVRVQNSWGSQWADHGRAWIQQEDLARLLSEEGEACAAVEQRVAPHSQAA